MIIELTNFRCWKKKTFTFPDNGLILLSGASGTGKSSILNAIYFVLFGVGTKIISNDEKKCTVRLVFQNFDVTRTKGPNRLLLFCNNEEYEDEVAQKLINDKFGINFTTTSYITQKMVQSFLNMGPSDKMNFLEQLSLSKTNDISNIKKKTKEQIKEKENSLLEKTSQLKVLTDEFSNMIIPEEILFPLHGKYSEVKIKNESIYWKRTQKELSSKNTEKKKIEDDFNKEKIVRVKFDSISKNIELLNKKIESLEIEFKEIEFDGEENLDKLKSDLNTKKRKRKYIDLKKRYDEEKENFDSLLQQENDEKKEKLKHLESQIEEQKEKLLKDDEIKDINDSIEILVDFERLTKKLEQKKEKLKVVESSLKNTENSDISNKKLELLKKEKENIEQRTVIKKCPCCDASLIISDGKLISKKEEPIDEKNGKKEIERIVSEIKILQKKIDEVKKDEIISGELISEIKKITKELQEYEVSDDSSLIDLQKTIEYQKSNRVKYEDLVSKKKDLSIKTLSLVLKKLSSQIESREKELSEYDDEDFDDNNKISEDELQSLISSQQLLKHQKNNTRDNLKTTKQECEKISKEQTKIIVSSRDFKDELLIISSEIKVLGTKNIDHKRNHDNLQKYIEYRKKIDEYNKWSDKVDTCKKEEKTCRMLLSFTEIFMKKIQEAESIAISQTIDTINYYMNFYLEKFFINDPITVEIFPYKETKKDIKPTINLEVGYKGMNIDINSLSGGEYDRVTLSIVLALNTLFGSDLLMLDESIASLDADLTNEILDVLKEHLREKLVIVVAHQIGVGVFDNVIEL